MTIQEMKNRAIESYLQLAELLLQVAGKVAPEFEEQLKAACDFEQAQAEYFQQVEEVAK